LPSEEELIGIVVAAAADIDAVADRTATALRRLEQAGAGMHLQLAARRAAETLADIAAVLRRDSFLDSGQQRLL
jgi:hypothetical protein